MFDTFRGILMLSIPLSHFTKAASNWYASLYYGPDFYSNTLSGFIYITINVFVMQAFMFLSGYFSKKPDRARETAFRGVLWPYLVFTTITLIAAWGFDAPIGKYFSYLTPSFALWFLLALFMYRYFLVDIIKFKWALPMSIFMMLAAAVIPFGQFMALGRVFSYFPFFMLGFYCSKETLDKVRSLNKGIVAVLGVALVAGTILLMKFGPSPSWFLLKEDCSNFGMPWYQDVLCRIIVFALACGWITFMVNILSSKKNFLCYIGTNTMPIYLFHLGIRHIITQYNLYMGVFATLVVAWFALISLFHRKHGNWTISVIITLASMAGVIWICMSGILQPLYGLCPENLIVFYIVLIGTALLAGISFSAPFWAKLYDILTEGFAKTPLMVQWLQGTKDEDEKAEAK